MYLLAAFVLLVVMLFFILRPWLFATEPVAVGAVDLTDPAARARSVATVERVVRTPTTAPASASAAATALVTADVGDVDDMDDVTAAQPALDLDATPPAEPATSAPADEVRASVEAAIAARKAALRAQHCTSCEAVVEDGDAFCRSCGTKVTA